MGSARGWLGVLAYVLLLGCSPEKPKPPLPTGHYEGTLTYQGSPIKAVLDLREPVPGQIQADFVLPEMDGLGFAGQNLLYRPPQLHFERTPGQASGNMVVEAVHEGNFLRGEFITDSLQAELLLVRRGQPEPRAYREEKMTFRSGPLSLAGTLLLPNDTLKRHPAVVLLHGSGTPRQSDLLAYAVLLAKNGFAALVYDRRDAKLPAAQPREYSHDDLAADALAVVRGLKTRTAIDSNQVGLWGISQGAHVAALVAGQAGKPVRFVVAISGPGVNYATVGRYQNAERLRRQGYEAADIKQMNRAFEALEQYVRQEGKADTAALHQVLADARQQPWARYTSLPSHVPTPAEIQTQLQWRQLYLDPRAAWQKVRVPSLLLYGGADDRFDARESARRLRAVVGGRNGSQVRVFPNADHELMLPAGIRPDTQGQWAWPRPAPGYIEDMLAWMRRQTKQ